MGLAMNVWEAGIIRPINVPIILNNYYSWIGIVFACNSARGELGALESAVSPDPIRIIPGRNWNGISRKHRTLKQEVSLPIKMSG